MSKRPAGSVRRRVARTAAERKNAGVRQRTPLLRAAAQRPADYAEARIRSATRMVGHPDRQAAVFDDVSVMETVRLPSFQPQGWVW